MTTTISSIIAALIIAQGVHSYNASQPDEPTTTTNPTPTFALTPDQASAIKSEVHGVAGGIRNWHSATVATAEQWATTPEQIASAKADRLELNAGIERQDKAISLFDSIIGVFGM
jgi:hypothetical protein